MPVDIDRLTIEDLKMLLHIQREKAAREAEEKRLAEEVEAEWVAAAAAAQKVEEEAKEKARRARKAAAAKKWKATEVVESGSDAEPGPSQKKGKGKVRAESVESVEELGDACQR
jgi:membrane protein involved in colicin uptake